MAFLFTRDEVTIAGALPTTCLIPFETSAFPRECEGKKKEDHRTFTVPPSF